MRGQHICAPEPWITRVRPEALAHQTDVTLVPRDHLFRRQPTSPTLERMAWLLIHGEGAQIEAHGLDLVAYDGAIRLDLPAGGEVRVGRLVPGREAGLDTGGPRLRLLSPTLSREHFILFERDHRWCVRDNRSTGGTFINGDLVRLTRSEVPHVLAEGDVVHLGAPVGAPWAIFRSE